ncbi:MAG TPA: bifunctional diaminohydroxyphosphoribosylaminopyrimidine deaminase/5-amino-6-(5-phosphoribosylamino)uracil reductase RibD [Spirochaetota bacterium]|nr:bifunctional diaminohydroxyphosphoribosylaminopyrimidine deaminase/5-amino-6-(5-phosphoribosylamino)uracil reductase RibD [Spirochaetota bacterium]HPF04709.1 bifunctional diaminohydroxyphosphoribosylaminopyrimidine deaminase/5-amino-6-(5-phosphoribosylamino)uracil reductase RibD [Spirochaetota bacterium]HPJ41928.1 bifunctional diaminohydroxyphosphoribosylaminopyrimidine deaminase/5-amino-6-(5-phosphoribosylamino)uracil reductase RibD [Spirochaetota bacterium]HPR38050.1 bifunctional diaminohyd
MSDKEKFMQMACEIAFSKMGKTSPNPSVGAVIVKNGNIIGKGGTGVYGSDHAEIVALKQAMKSGADIKGAEIFVSLEPCSHYGKTPPCADAIIKSGIKKVYVPILDPNPLVAGKGIRMLTEAGVEVEMMHSFSPAASDLLRGFKKYILRGRSFIINKCAVTLDGKIATSAGDSKWISSEPARLFVHKLRSKVDAVIVGKNTFINDNPSLNIRPEDFDENARGAFSDGKIKLNGRDNFLIEQLIKAEPDPSVEPLRILIGMPDSIPANCNFFRNDNYVIIAGEQSYNWAINRNPSIKELADKLNLFICTDSDPDEETDFIFRILKEKGVMNAMLEGGGGVNGTFFNSGAIDQFMYMIAPKVAGDGISPIRGAGLEKMSDSLLLYDISTAMIGNDLLYCGYREQYNFEMM